MSSHSPQRQRKSLGHPSNPVAMQQQQQQLSRDLQPQHREMTPSPTLRDRDRPRAMKTLSVSMLPSQMYSATAGRHSPQSTSQPHSPTAPVPPNRRASPQLPPGQMQRGLPTPPHPPVLPESALVDVGIPSSSPPQGSLHTHYPRPVNRIPAAVLAKFQGMDENYQMTEQMIAAEMAAAQAAAAQAREQYSIDPPAPPPQPKEPGLERVRSIGKSSPRQRDKPQTPERRGSPGYANPLGSPGEHPNSSYVQPPPNPRRNTVADTRSLPTVSNPSPSFPAHHTRSPPDKSLPVQEEPEDDVAANQQEWKREPTKSSPAPPNEHSQSRRYDRDPSSGRNSRAGHRAEEEDDTLVDQSSSDPRGESSGSHTPRSPSAAGQHNDGRQQQHRKSTSMGRGRASATDQLGLSGIDPSVFDRPFGEPPQYAEQSRGRNGHYVPQPPRESVLHAPRASQQQQYNQYYARTPSIYSEDMRYMMEHPTSAYIQNFGSPRPDAPIPPTPHSQTNPPSPSPLISGHYEHELPPFSPIVPAGSPYPFPFSHVRRNANYASQNPMAPSSTNYDMNHPAAMAEQLSRQFQVYAQNNLGNVTDSTLSPSNTPFPRGYFNQWASWHTQRILNGAPIPGTEQGTKEAMSIASSPSHEPVSLPKPPGVGLRKRETVSNLRQRRSLSRRKPPPRVQSTQPRETSPELTSSGEETAGEETPQEHDRFAVPEEGNWVNGQMPLADDADDWVDEDEDGEDDDLLELEYHPSFVSNVEKRRRRWETRWDALLQAFQALDRQTDATMVLLAAPSHSTKLHMVSSRSIRRRLPLAKSPMVASIRAGFKQIAADRRASRSLRTSLADRFLTPASPGGSETGSGESSLREQDLQRALSAALSSLGVLGQINDQREARWRDEMRRISEDRERVEFLLRQALGDTYGMGGGGGIPAPPIVNAGKQV